MISVFRCSGQIWTALCKGSWLSFEKGDVNNLWTHLDDKLTSSSKVLGIINWPGFWKQFQSRSFWQLNLTQEMQYVLAWGIYLYSYFISWERCQSLLALLSSPTWTLYIPPCLLKWQFSAPISSTAETAHRWHQHVKLMSNPGLPWHLTRLAALGESTSAIFTGGLPTSGLSPTLLKIIFKCSLSGNKHAWPRKENRQTGAGSRSVTMASAFFLPCGFFLFSEITGWSSLLRWRRKIPSNPTVRFLRF